MLDSTALKIFGFLVPVFAVLFGLSQTGFWSSGWLRNPLNDNVEGSGPKSYTLSDDPVVVYVKDFISAEEAAHLVGLA